MRHAPFLASLYNPSGTYTFKFGGTPFLWGEWIEATGDWTGAMTPCNSARMVMSENGEWTIYAQAFVGAWAVTSRGQKTIVINDATLQENYDFIVSTIHHELGHVAGFTGDGTNCPHSDSVMTDRQPNQAGTNHVGCADIRQLQQNCAPPPPPSCPDNCNYAEPCPTEPEEVPVSCPITGPTDYCAYPSTGCPPGEDVSQYGSCCYQFNSPILLDLGHDGFELSSLDRGVMFSIGSVVRPYLVSWTLPFTNDAWLVLDRNGNGTIDTGAEMFGNHTEQPAPPGREMKNGFRALAQFDQREFGGNRDGQIDERDGVFERLRLWQDFNHNGVSESEELSTLRARGITALALECMDSRHSDSFGNVFRFRSKVTAAQPSSIGPWAYDVFLKARRR